MYKSSLAFVPKCNPTRREDVIKLKEFIDRNNRLCVLTGAGISTESGIPDYRSEEVGLYARSNHKPVFYQEFCKSEASRKRYWARNYVGWPRFIFYSYFFLAYIYQYIKVTKVNNGHFIFQTYSLTSI